MVLGGSGRWRWRRSVRTSCDGCDGQVRTPAGPRTQQFCGLQRARLPRAVRTSGATGCDARFAPVAARNARDSAAFGRSGANLSATGATHRFAPFRAQKSRISAAFRRSARRLVRTANPESRAVASEISPGAPRYPFRPRKDPETRSICNKNVPEHSVALIAGCPMSTICEPQLSSITVSLLRTTLDFAMA